jgi:hypothetical protein
MADAGVLPASRTERALERMKTTAGVVAALAGAITGMWTIYEKVRTDARQYTAASYETLAPQVNQMNEALRKLEEDNRQLKQALLATHPERAHPARSTRVAAARPAEPAAPAPPPPGGAAPAAPGTVPAAPPAAPQGQADDALGRVLGTVNQTREAVEAVRKVPETFQKVLESRGKK